MKDTEFRILGSKLGEDDTFIDVVLDGIDGDGKVYFVEKNGSRTWSLRNAQVESFVSQKLMLGTESIKDHPLWDEAVTLGEIQSKAKTESAKEDLIDAQRSVFVAAFKETTRS